MFGLVIVEDEDSDEDLFVSINDLCWSAKRASAAVVGVKYGEYHIEGCGLPTPVAAWWWWCWSNRWTAAILPCCSRNSKLTAACRFHLVLEKKNNGI